MGTKKNFVLDTNVLLHDPKSIYNFQENDIYLPIVVLEELDHFKKGGDQLSFNARSFAREMDLLSDIPDFFTNGASLGKGQGRLYVVHRIKYPEVLNNAFIDRVPDHRIIATAMQVAQNSSYPTVLVTKDLNLRMKARSLGLTTQDYFNDKVTDADLFDKSHVVYDDIDPDVINEIYRSSRIDPELIEDRVVLTANDCFVLQSGSASVLCRYNPFSQMVEKVDKRKCYGIEARNAEQTFALELLTDPQVQLVAVTGKAGTGKTLLALAAALAQHQEYNQILLARPIVALSNKDLGYLPGDEQKKIAPYMQPLFDNLNFIKRQFSPTSQDVKRLEEMQTSGQLIIEALAFIRGRTLSQTYCIIDEAQNLTPHEVKTIVTRAGQEAKIVFTGDVQQIDTPYLDAQSNGLVYLMDRMKNQPLFAHVNLVKGERSALSELAGKLL